MAKAEKNVLSEAASLDTKILVESFRYKNNHIIQIQWRHETKKISLLMFEKCGRVREEASIYIQIQMQMQIQ